MTRVTRLILLLAALGLDLVAEPAQGNTPFAHPKYWAAFVLIGDPN